MRGIFWWLGNSIKCLVSFAVDNAWRFRIFQKGNLLELGDVRRLSGRVPYDQETLF